MPQHFITEIITYPKNRNNRYLINLIITLQLKHCLVEPLLSTGMTSFKKERKSAYKYNN